MSKNIMEQEVLKRANELEYDTDRYGAGSLMCQTSHVNSSRVIMINHQLGHAVNIKDPEPALVPSGFENALGKYSSMLVTADADYKVVAKFVKNEYTYVLIGYDKKHKRYNAWKREELEEHSEGFATRYKNTFIDSLEIGDTIQKGKLIKKSESFDKFGNYGLGKNLNTVYMISTKVHEDGIVIMNGADKKMINIKCHTFTIPLNDNEIFLNLYGDKKHYKAFPDVGEKVNNGILAAVRRIDNSKAIYALKEKHLRKAERGDLIYHCDGRVIDMDIRYNKDRTKLIDSGANSQINQAYIEQQEYYKKLYEYMIDIVDRAEDEGYTYTDEFSMICSDAYDYIDSSAFFADFNESVAGNMVIDIRVMTEDPIVVGTKLAGRSGNKGVVAKIIPPEDSYFMEDGRPIEVIAAALGIVGRLNPAQLNEHSINDLSYTAIQKMKELDDPDDKLRVVYDLMKFLNSKEAKDFKKYCKEMDKSDKKAFCKKIEHEGIRIIQEPIDNANIMDIANAYEKYEPNYQRIVYPDGSKSRHKVICSKMYYIKEKQDPIDKFSARSRGPVNPLHALPSKSNLKKKGLEKYPDTPVRIGEIENEILNAMTNHPALVADFINENSTSVSLKLAMAEQSAMGDIEDEIILDCENGDKNNIAMIDGYIYALGSRIEVDYEYATDDDYFTDDLVDTEVYGKRESGFLQKHAND